MLYSILISVLNKICGGENVTSVFTLETKQSALNGKENLYLGLILLLRYD